MKLNSAAFRSISAAFLFLFLVSFSFFQDSFDKKFLSYTADLKSAELKLYWKNYSSKPLKSILNLKNYLSAKKKKLVFAMNGGMYMEDNSPLGLYIENGKTLRKLNTFDASGNFYLKPNGVFYITENKKGVVCKTEDFKNDPNIKFATQSGPMLLIDGEFHTAFRQGSSNLNIRNGVGILPDGKVIFAMSKVPVNFYDFALFFKNKGCKNALYLDGSVSRTYLPEKDWIQTDGDFGVMIAASTAE